jgi:hypothetical protein
MLRCHQAAQIQLDNQCKSAAVPDFEISQAHSRDKILPANILLETYRTLCADRFALLVLKQSRRAL